MKSILLIPILLAALCLSNCGKSPIQNRIWQGEVRRTADSEKLSDVCLKFSGDSLYIYANAIFGAQSEQLIRVGHRDGVDEYACSRADQGPVFEMSIDYAADEATGAEKLTVRGGDFQMNLTPASEPDFTAELLAFYKHRDVPRDASLYLSGRWQGEIVRTRDKQRLSDVCLEYDPDTLKVYSNAIFGSANEKLCCIGFADGAYIYANAAGDEFVLQPKPERGRLSMVGDDFQMQLKPLSKEWADALKFYRKRNVPRSADAYLFGSYSGRMKARLVQMEALGPVYGLMPGFMNMEATMTIDFLEGNRCKFTTDAGFTNPEMQMLLALGGGGSRIHTVKTYDYKVVGNKLLFGKTTAYIRPNGTLFIKGLVDGHIEANDLILHRQ